VPRHLVVLSAKLLNLTLYMSDLRRVIGDRLIPCTMGANASQLEKDIGSDLFPANEHYFGLVNFGNTCYSNSVLQALYFCRPFREKVLEYKAKNKRTKETLLTCLADLFYSIVTQKRKVGTIAPKKFIARLRKEKVEFDNYMQQVIMIVVRILLKLLRTCFRTLMSS